jgi:hypothetical protein
MNEPWVALLAEILRDTPRLPNPACAGLHTVMDNVESPEPGLAVCRRCPSQTRTACNAWASSAPPRLRPSGVCGGEIHVHRSATHRTKRQTAQPHRRPTS